MQNQGHILNNFKTAQDCGLILIKGEGFFAKAAGGRGPRGGWWLAGPPRGYGPRAQWRPATAVAWARTGSSPLRRTRARRGEARAQARCARCGGCKARASRGCGGPKRAARTAAASASGEVARTLGSGRGHAETAGAFAMHARSSGKPYLGANGSGRAVRRWPTRSR